MENDILDSLNDLGYGGPLSDEVAFSKALDGGPKSLEYTKLVHILSEELKELCNLEETVNVMSDPDESSSFLLELSSFLKELGCPYKKLITGHMSSRLQTKEDRILLLDYLISELMAAKMVRVDCPKEKQNSGMEIIVQESPTAKDLKDILIALKFNKPPPNITLEMLFSKLESKLKDTIQKEGDHLVGKPIYNKALTEKDWRQLETTFTELFEEYRLRREMLITRLECTIQSFEWSDRLKIQKDVIQSAYRPKREQLKVKPNIKLSDFLAARSSLLQVEKTSSASVRKNTQTQVNKVIIGQVPDRGGRPNEQQPPPPEMPSWQQRSAPRGGGRGGQRGHGGGRGGERGGHGGERGGHGGERGGHGGERGGHGGENGGRGGRGGRVHGGYNQTGAGDLGRPQTSPATFNQNHRNYQTYEVPPGGYNTTQATYNQNHGGYNQNHGGYSQNQVGYSPNQIGYSQNQGGYGGYNQGYDSGVSYNQGYNQGEEEFTSSDINSDNVRVIECSKTCNLFDESGDGSESFSCIREPSTSGNNLLYIKLKPQPKTRHVTSHNKYDTNEANDDSLERIKLSTDKVDSGSVKSFDLLNNPKLQPILPVRESYNSSRNTLKADLPFHETQRKRTMDNQHSQNTKISVPRWDNYSETIISSDSIDSSNRLDELSAPMSYSFSENELFSSDVVFNQNLQNCGSYNNIQEDYIQCKSGLVKWSVSNQSSHGTCNLDYPAINSSDQEYDHFTKTDVFSRLPQASINLDNDEAVFNQKSDRSHRVNDNAGDNKGSKSSDTAGPQQITYSSNKSSKRFMSQPQRIIGEPVPKSPKLSHKSLSEKTTKESVIGDSPCTGNVLDVEVQLLIGRVMQHGLNKIQEAIQREIKSSKKFKKILIIKYTNTPTGLRIACGNLYTRLWLKSRIKSIEPWPGAKLVILDVNDRRRNNVSVTKSSRDNASVPTTADIAKLSGNGSVTSNICLRNEINPNFATNTDKTNVKGTRDIGNQTRKDDVDQIFSNESKQKLKYVLSNESKFQRKHNAGQAADKSDHVDVNNKYVYDLDEELNFNEDIDTNIKDNKKMKNISSSRDVNNDNTSASNNTTSDRNQITSIYKLNNKIPSNAMLVADTLKSPSSSGPQQVTKSSQVSNASVPTTTDNVLEVELQLLGGNFVTKDLVKLRCAILREIVLTTNDEKPKLILSAKRNGEIKGLRIKCKNLYAKTWLKTHLNCIEPWPGAKLAMFDVIDEHLVNINDT